MSARQIARLFGVAAVATGARCAAPIPAASAAPCPDIEVVFARGTFEPPGVGGIGQSFVDSVRSQAGGKSVEVYPVNYPASTDFPTAVVGIRDAANRIEATAAACPDTKIVLGGILAGSGRRGIRHLGSGPERSTGGGRARPDAARGGQERRRGDPLR